MSNMDENEPGAARPSALRSFSGWILGGIVIVWAIAMMLLANRMDVGAPDLSKPQVGAAAVDYNWSLTDLNGRIVPFSEFKGKTVFLNVWATWCGPCVAEMPSIDALTAEKSLNDVVFLGVSVDEEADAVKQFVARHSPKFRVLLPVGDLPEQFVTEGIPATFIISPSGEIVASHVGSASWDSPEVVALLARLSTASAPE
jgi:thiol-disulfide isomerase/thioredoxin